MKLPRNIRVIQLPDLDLGKAYPTLGPGGSIVTNVNGLAGGIELYLGRDVLKDPEAQPLVDKGLFGDRFVPVQWRGYNQALKRYQGELLGKDQIRNRFFERTKAWRANPESCPDRDWSALKAIWDAIRMTFAE